jgi:putative transcriptional regulator
LGSQEEYAYLTLPASEGARSCVGLVLAGMAARARIGVAGLEEAVELLEERHIGLEETRYRFSITGDGLVAEVEESEDGVDGFDGARWRTVVELIA